jgi:uncharacterized protein (DUF433 family)
MGVNGKLIGIGLYTAAEAARLLRVPRQRLNRWMGGYQYHADGELRRVEPLWTPQIPRIDDELGLSFCDLAELRFIVRFREAGLSLQTIRGALRAAQRIVEAERPFSTHRFATDGRKIFLEIADRTKEPQLIELAKDQYAFKPMMEPSLKDLEFEDGALVRWWPLPGSRSIVIDPQRSFGQPIAARSGVPTATLATAVEVEGTVKAAARVFEVDPNVVRDAVRFEARLAA